MIASTAHVSWQHQALDHLTVFEVALHDFIHIMFVNHGVPNALGINHRHRAACAAV
jgi:hypothetical protein